MTPTENLEYPIDRKHPFLDQKILLIVNFSSSVGNY